MPDTYCLLREYPEDVVTDGPVPVAVPQQVFGQEQIQVTCGNCLRTVLTTTKHENGACVWTATRITCLVCCPCSWIPFLIESWKDVRHTCPACGVMLGHYKKM